MRLALLGDIALFGKNNVLDGTYRNRMGVIKEVLDGCDYVVGNLETPLTDAAKTIGGKSAYIKGAPADVEILNWLGVTHVSLANNHIFDYRVKGFNDTVRVLEESGIRWYGANGRVETIEDDSRVVLYGYCCYSTNGKHIGEKIPCVDVLDPIRVEKDLRAAKAEDAYPILSVHWGQEHVHYPNYDHVLLARKLSSGNKLTIHGHHPHVLQGIEEYENALIAYSLGNFCFDDVYTNKSTKPLVKMSDANKESCVLVLTFENGGLSRHEIVPFSFHDNTYRIDKRVKGRIDSYTTLLSKDEESFRSERTAALKAYLHSRKQLRDLNWYLKRMNFDSASMIISAKLNSIAYRQMINRYLTDSLSK